MKINKKFVLLCVLFNCAGTQQDAEAILQCFRNVRIIHAEFAEKCETLVQPVAIPQSLLHFLGQVRMHYSREVIRSLQNQKVTGLSEALSARIAEVEIDDDRAVEYVMQEIILLKRLTVGVPSDQSETFQKRMSNIMGKYLRLVKRWEGEGCLKTELLTESGQDFIERVERAEDKLSVVEEMIDSHAKFEQESSMIDFILGFGKYLENQLAYVLDVCRESGIDPKINKYDFILFLQMQGLPLVKELREADDKPKAIAEILDAYEARGLSIETMDLDKWQNIHQIIEFCANKEMLRSLKRSDKELKVHAKAFHQAMLDPVNLTAWVWFHESRTKKGELITVGPEELPQGERDLKNDVFWVCSTLNESIKIEPTDAVPLFSEPQNTQRLFSFLDEQLIKFLERYAQDTDNNIPPLHPEKYKSATDLKSNLENLKTHNPGSNENIDKVLGLIQNETAKVAKNIQTYSNAIEVQIRYL